jgi:hypothetical protein
VRLDVLATILSMSKRQGFRCCWGGHLFASNVGVLPTEPDGYSLDARLVLSIPKKRFSRHYRKRQRQLRHKLLHACCPDVTGNSVPTIDTRTQGR